jgi:hypothetical protein
MAPLTIVVRPKSGYAKPNQIRTIQVDTSQRVEAIISELKLDKKGTHFYSNQAGQLYELPLNSSLATHNIQNGTVLETCACPELSAVLSAVLQDLNAVDRLPSHQRTEEHIRPLLDGATLNPWSDRWSHEDIKTRIICLAMMKKCIQRQDRYESLFVPPCKDLHALCEFMQPIWDTRGMAHNSMAHIVKRVAKNRGGLHPTTCWELLQNKLDKLHRIIATTTLSHMNHQDVIEEFVKADTARHKKSNETPRKRARTTPQGSGTSTTPLSTPRQPPRRRLLYLNGPSPGTHAAAAVTAAAASNTSTVVKCSLCDSPADSVCLETNCPFCQHLSCVACFAANHPILQRNHERVALLTDPRAKSLLKEVRRTPYIPEYASGPFCILSTLYAASQGKHHPLPPANPTPHYHQHHRQESASGAATHKEYSLTESRLKELAQPACRSNLFDRQARGVNAFAAIDGLSKRGWIRSEIIPNSEESKFSLLPPEGEHMGHACHAMECALQQIWKTTDMIHEQQEALRTTIIGSSRTLKLIIDTREDAAYASRLVQRCEQGGMDHDCRELPTGGLSLYHDDQRRGNCLALDY